MAPHKTPKIVKSPSFKKMEQKWQKAWEQSEIFHSPDSSQKKKYYVCEMFPYPSAYYLHVGHLRNYVIGDTIARYKRMRGFNVLYPMGFDAFGLPAENAAIKNKTHPKKYTEDAIKKIRTVLKSIGQSYDWSREISTCNPNYYKWNQWLFLRMFEKGIAYRKKAPVNWCPSCKTVLANEEVISGKCWRCDSEVTISHLEQWFLKITEYAEELLKGLDGLNWPSRVKELQRNWIGKSEGTRVIFPIDAIDRTIEVFTTRADTIYGVTFLSCAIQHELVATLVKGTKHEAEYQKMLSKTTASEKLGVEKDKEGFFTGRYAIQPLTGEKIPIYAGNFVVADYGTGAVMGVPAHDERDFEFAKKHKIPIKQVISNSPHTEKSMTSAFTEEGNLINSDIFTGLPSNTAKQRISELLEKKGSGGKSVEYKLRDWLISRQRYWGTPIPIVYCENCGTVPVPDKELPIKLPDKVKFTGKGNPLSTSKTFVETTCPFCEKPARRETDTMATFFDSSWYFLRYCSPSSQDIFDRKNVGYWMPIDQYIGGIEHAVLHLLYARFFTKFLRDLGWLIFDEPFTRLFNQGIVHKDSQRMSKSHGNVVSVDEITEKYGTDTARLFLMFVSSPDKDMEWDDQGMEGMSRVVKRFTEMFSRVGGSADATTEHKANKTLKIMEQSYENFEFNKGLVSFVELVNYLADKPSVPRHILEMMLLTIAPIMPHLCEELWHKLGRATLVAQESWPKIDENKINESLDVAEKQLDTTISDIITLVKLVREKSKKETEKVYLYVIPKELEIYNPDIIAKRVGLPISVFAVNDESKYDPQNKSQKAKLGRPAIYIE